MLKFKGNTNNKTYYHLKCEKKTFTDKQLKYRHQTFYIKIIFLSLNTKKTFTFKSEL